MSRTTTIGIGAKLGLDTKEAAAALKEYQRKFEDHSRALTKITAIKLRPEFELKARPEAARPYAEIKVAAESASKATDKFGNSARIAGAGLNQTTTSSNRMGQTLLNLGYIADDAAYGMRGIINNIAPLVMGMGLGAGVAGAIQILGVVLRQGVVYWDDWTGATARAGRAARDTAKAEKAAAEALELAQRRGEAQATFVRARTADRLRYREGRNAEVNRSDRLRELGQEADVAEVNSGAGRERNGSESARGNLSRIRKENEVDRAREKDSIVERTRAAADERASDDKRAQELKAEIKRMENRSAELEHQEDERKARIADYNARIANNIVRGTGEARVANVGLRKLRKEDEDLSAEQAKLAPALTALKEELAAVEAAVKTSEGKFADLKQEGGPEAEARERIRKAKETEAQIEAEKAAFEEAGNVVTGALRMVGREFLYLGQVAQMGIEKKRSENAADVVKRDLSISEIRSPQRRRRAERAVNLADETKRLMGQDSRLSPEEAADMAARSQRVRDRAAGDRTIRGGGPARQYEGLDGFRRQGNMADRPLPDPVRERGAAALRRAKADADKAAAAGGSAGDPGLKIVAEKLQQLIELTRDNAKTPAERQAPARRS